MSRKSAVQTDTPLCVDLDGTLTHTDLLLESFFHLLKKNPLIIFWCFIWLLKGKANLKDQLASRTSLDVSILPYNAALIGYLEAEHATGRPLYLCTASNFRLAEAVSKNFGFFDGIFASTSEVNLSGRNKAKKLVEAFGDGQFDYCGNASIDTEVWKHAKTAIAIGNISIKNAASGVNQNVIHFETKKNVSALIAKEIRVYQWIKNLLIFVPLLSAHRFNDIRGVVDAAIAFAAFSLCASSVYLLNDLLDLDSDRRHERKRRRPLASGQLSLSTAACLAVLLLIASALLSTFLPVRFIIVLAGYFVITLAYSFALKRATLVDVFTLAALYTVRIIAGGAATTISLSSWMILFSILIFLSLAMVKRYTELDANARAGRSDVSGRGYSIQDMGILQALGCTAGFMAVLVLALYMNSPGVDVLYRHPKVLWILFTLLMYWVSHIWMTTSRGEMHDDPIVFAVKNRLSRIVIILCIVSVIIAT